MIEPNRWIRNHSIDRLIDESYILYHLRNLKALLNLQISIRLNAVVLEKLTQFLRNTVDSSRDSGNILFFEPTEPFRGI